MKNITIIFSDSKVYQFDKTEILNFSMEYDILATEMYVFRFCRITPFEGFFQFRSFSLVSYIFKVSHFLIPDTLQVKIKPGN